MFSNVPLLFSTELLRVVTLHETDRRELSRGYISC